MYQGGALGEAYCCGAVVVRGGDELADLLGEKSVLGVDNPSRFILVFLSLRVGLFGSKAAGSLVLLR